MEFIKYEEQGEVGIVTISREKALNALNSQVLEELDATFDAIDVNKIRAVVLTGAGATFPYGIDPDDKNIRLAPTYPPIEDLSKAMDLFVICVKIAAAEKLLAE